MSRDRCTRPARVPDDDPRDAALDVHIAIAQAIPSARPLFFLAAEDATGRAIFHTAVPTDALAAIVGESRRNRQEAEDLDEANASLREQRDFYRNKYEALLSLRGDHRPGPTRPRRPRP